MNCYLLLFLSFCFSTHVIPLEPRQEAVFYEEVKEDGLQFSIRLDLKSDSNVVFRIREPHEANESGSPSLENQISKFSFKKDYFYDKKGIYTIRINNLDPMIASVAIRSTVDKPYEADDDFSELRKHLLDLGNNLDSTYNANFRLKQMKDANIKDAMKAQRRLLLLCFLPLSYILIGFLKLKKMKMFFQPNK